jgi:hypothetical protein
MGRTEQELKDASVHVKYEIVMFLATMSFLSKSGGATDQVTGNAYIVSSALHLRNLIEFFYKRRSSSVILAAHYVSAEALWVRDRGRLTPFLDREKGRASERITHLSFGRLVTDEGWRWAGTRAELQRVMNCFLSNLPPERRPWFAGTGLEGPSGPSGTSTPPVDTGWTGPPEPPDPEKANTSE